eukprot:470566-Pelagomonas_calceolata.AAC.2
MWTAGPSPHPLAPPGFPPHPHTSDSDSDTRSSRHSEDDWEDDMSPFPSPPPSPLRGVRNRGWSSSPRGEQEVGGQK